MDVDAPLGRTGQNVVGQDSAIGRHHNQLGRQGLNLGQGSAVSHLHGLENRDIMCKGTFLYRCWLELVLVPSHRLIRLGEHPADLVPGGYQSLQGRDGKFRGAHEENSHAWSSCSISLSNSSEV